MLEFRQKSTATVHDVLQLNDRVAVVPVFLLIGTWLEEYLEGALGEVRLVRRAINFYCRILVMLLLATPNHIDFFQLFDRQIPSKTHFS